MEPSDAKSTFTDAKTPIIQDEILRYRIRKMIDEPPPASRFKSLLNHSLATVIIGFLLTGVVGGLLTHYYNFKQKELETQRTNERRESDRLHEEQVRQSDREREDAKRESDRRWMEQQRDLERTYQERQRETERLRDTRQKELEYQRGVQQRELEREKSFADELNKVRIAKIGEVWEKAYLYESVSEQLRELWWNKYMKAKDAAEIESVERERIPLLSIVNERKQKLNDALEANRFWIGEDMYSQIQRYVLISDYYHRDVRGSTAGRHFTGKTVEELAAERKRLRASLERLRSDFLRDKAR